MVDYWHGYALAQLAHWQRVFTKEWAAYIFSRALVIDCDSLPVLYFTLTSWHAFLEKWIATGLNRVPLFKSIWLVRNLKCAPLLSAVTLRPGFLNDMALCVLLSPLFTYLLKLQRRVLLCLCLCMDQMPSVIEKSEEFWKVSFSPYYNHIISGLFLG